MTIHLNSTEKVIVATSSAAILLGLIGIAHNVRGGLQIVLSALIVVFSGLTIVLTVRGAYARRSSPRAP